MELQAKITLVIQRYMEIKLSLMVFSASVLMACSGETDRVKDTTKPAYSAEDEALYMERFNSRGKSQATGLKAYDPLAAVAGNDDYSALPASSRQTISEDALKAAQDYVTDKNSSAFMVWRNGGLETEHYFDDFDKDSLIVSKSLAKPLSTIAVGRAIAEGHIKSLDQPVADFITEWEGTDKAKILVRHLLDIRSGLLPQGQELEPEHVMNRAYMHPHHDEVIINDYPLVDIPGTRYDYANATAELIAPLIERATGVQYEDWVSNEILKPLGAKGGEVWMNREGGTPHSGCCILLTADTYMRMAILYLQEGTWDGQQLLTAGFVAEVKTATPQNPHTGMGVYVAGPYIEKRGPLNPEIKLGQTLHSEPYLANDLYMFDGNGHQVAYIIPSADMVILRTGSWMPKDVTWDNSVLPNVLLQGIQFPEGQVPVPQK